MVRCGPGVMRGSWCSCRRPSRWSTGGGSATTGRRARACPPTSRCCTPSSPRPGSTTPCWRGCGPLCAPTAPFDLELRRTTRFPETIYLAPEPAEPFRTLTAAIAAEWPEAPPYGGAYPDVTPHLTIGDAVTTEVMDEIDADVAPQLPLRTRITEAHLWVFDGARWQPRERLPFAA